MPILTDVSDIHVTYTGDEYSDAKIWLQCDAKYYGAAKRRLNGLFYLRFNHGFNCCGMRTIANMSILNLCPEFGSVKMLNRLVGVLNRMFNGGNVAFVINTTQKRTLARVLQNMDSIGGGLSSPVKFRNHNMGNYNWLYVWTFKGTIKPGVANVDVAS